jgi:hypothetical protein
MAQQALVPQNILLVSETKIKNFTDIDQNVTSQVLLPFISVVQQTKLEYLIGRPYYVQLLDQVATNTLSTINQNFLEYFVQPAVLWWAYGECLPSVWGRIKNNGIVNGAEQSVTLKEMQWFTEKAIERAEFFQERMRQEIIFNSNNYPLCFNYTSSQGLFPHLGVNYFSGLHLTNGHGDILGMAMNWRRAGIGYYSGPEYACVWGGGC